jgi:hypothetical protein
MMRKIFCLLGLSLLFNLVWAAGVNVTATGFGPSNREALMAAQRRAVEKGIGVLLDSQSMTDNMVLIEDKIYNKARGYVRNYIVISETKQRDGNWSIVIQCEVAEEKLKLSLKALGILWEKIGNPRIMVVYDPAITDGISSKNHPVVSEAYEGIVEYLTEREFPVVAKRSFYQSILKEFPSSKNRYRKTVAFGLRKRAEYILVYHIKPGDKESTSIFNKGWVMISAKIIDTSSGQIISNQNKKVIGVDKDSMNFAFRKAGRKAGKLVAKSLESKLVNISIGTSVSGRVVVLEVMNIKDFSLLMEFRSQLKKAYGVRNIIQRNSTSSTAEYEIKYVGDIDTLKENAFTILKKMGLKAKNPISNGDRIRIEFRD